MNQYTKMELDTAAELESMIDRLDELEDWAVDVGYRALETKIQEARGPLSSAALAMRQYAEGVLKPKTDADLERDHVREMNTKDDNLIRQHLRYNHGLTLAEIDGDDPFVPPAEIHTRVHNG